ncbi:MAG: rhomboid family intramembrane serine protease [Chitinophagaceae bacterium]|nr:MAG: rhomboid family intramembrane serine protease [Chitinophagaceae bacterium]
MTGNNSILDDLKWQFSNGSMLIKLILINLGVFLTVHTVRVFLHLFVADGSLVDQTFNNLLQWFTLPASLLDLVKRPWTLVTHMFLHVGFFHILFNMLWLYWFGRIFREFLSERKLLPVYLFGGFAGAFLMILSYNLFPGLSSNVANVMALGASAGVLAVVVSTATMAPNYTIYMLFLGPVRIKYIAIFVVILDFISIPGGNTGGHIAHLGGAIFGFFYIRNLNRGYDITNGFDIAVNVVKSLFKVRKKGPKVAYKNKNVRYETQNVNRSQKGTKQNQSNASQADIDKQGRIDQILDKISLSGYDSLSKEEKEFLFRVSNEED